MDLAFYSTISPLFLSHNYPLIPQTFLAFATPRVKGPFPRFRSVVLPRGHRARTGGISALWGKTWVKTYVII